MPPAIKAKHQLVASLEAEMLKCVRADGGVSRSALARQLRLAPSTAGIYVDRLIREGFLLESEFAERLAAGRPPTLLRPNPDGGRYVGVDFDAHNILATAVDFSQQPLRKVHHRIGVSDSVERILAKIERAIEQVIAKDRRRILAIGLGVPGAIDPDAGIAQHYPFIPGWRDIPLGPRLRQRFGVPVFLENNIRSMALAELWFGQGRGAKDFVCLGIRTGIAAGVVVHGEILRGSGNRAGEVGHWSCPVPAELAGEFSAGAPPTGWSWRTDARLEQVASLSALIAAAQRAIASGRKSSIGDRNDAVSIEAILDAVREGDDLARSLLTAVARVHGWLAHQLNELFDPEKIIFAGPLAELGELFLTPVRAAAAEFSGRRLAAEITSSTLGRYNGALGAAALALHQWEPAR